MIRVRVSTSRRVRYLNLELCMRAYTSYTCIREKRSLFRSVTDYGTRSGDMGVGSCTTLFTEEDAARAVKAIRLQEEQRAADDIERARVAKEAEEARATREAARLVMLAEEAQAALELQLAEEAAAMKAYRREAALASKMRKEAAIARALACRNPPRLPVRSVRWGASWRVPPGAFSGDAPRWSDSNHTVSRSRAQAHSNAQVAQAALASPAHVDVHRQQPSQSAIPRAAPVRRQAPSLESAERLHSSRHEPRFDVMEVTSLEQWHAYQRLRGKLRSANPLIAWAA